MDGFTVTRPGRSGRNVVESIEMNERTVEGIFAHVSDRYRSLEAPRFSFVEEALDTNPYLSLLHRVGEHFDCTEDTDPNDDVSFGYVLRKESRVWVLRLSMVGPYAVVLRRRGDEAMEVIADECGDIVEEEERLLRLLEAEGLTTLDRDTLLRPIPLRLSNTAPEQVRLYQALFTDTDVVPWEGEAVPV